MTLEQYYPWCFIRAVEIFTILASVVLDGIYADLRKLKDVKRISAV
jgi:hypothetical protein